MVLDGEGLSWGTRRQLAGFLKPAGPGRFPSPFMCGGGVIFVLKKLSGKHVVLAIIIFVFCSTSSQLASFGMAFAVRMFSERNNLSYQSDRKEYFILKLPLSMNCPIGDALLRFRVFF